MKIGIVSVSFNQAAFLQEAVDSVTVPAYVVVDPGSTDGSREIIARNKARFAHILLAPDNGPADGLSKGFAACDSEIFGYLNSDDRFTPGALDYVADYFTRHPKIDLLLGAIRIIDANGKPRLRGRAPDRFGVSKFLAGTCFPWQQATFFRRELFERTGFNPANRACWDAELVLEMVLAGARIGYTNTILGDFRIYGESLTGSGRQAMLQQQEMERLRAEFKAHLFSPARERIERLFYRYNPARHWRCVFGIKLPDRQHEAGGKHPARTPDPEWSAPPSRTAAAAQTPAEQPGT